MDPSNTPDHSGQSRRQFFKKSSFALAGAAMAGSLGWTSLASAALRAGSANSRIGVGIVGAGSRGRVLLRECLRNQSEWQLDFPAVCDVWRTARESTADEVESETGRHPTTFSDYADLLAMDEIDCVIIATPDFTHTPVLIAAADAGKHVYVEKPMAVSLEQANAALDASLRNGTIVQAGTQFRSMPHFAEGARVVQSGELGELLKIDCHYHRPRLSWADRSAKAVSPEEVDWTQFLAGLSSHSFDSRRFRSWQLYNDYTVGPMGLLGTHVMDIATWFAGEHLPVSVTGIEAWLSGYQEETANFQEALFTYDEGFVMNCSCREGNSAPGSQVVFYGTRGTLRCPFSTKANLVLTPEGASATDRIEAREIAAEPSASHMKNWIDCIRSGTTKTNADIHAAYAHSIASVLAVQSAREGRRLRFDPSKREVTSG